MTESDLAALEAHIGRALPGFYRSTMAAYPFARESFAEEFMLLPGLDDVIEINDDAVEIESVDAPFFVGSDGGEESYFIDLSQSDSPVYEYDLEERAHRVLDSSWEKYLERLAGINSEIQADEAAMEGRARSKKWWEFWK